MKQDVFVGGIQQQFDATKFNVGQYRAALNCRVRQNVAVPAYEHVKIKTVSGVKQALFAIDDKLVLIQAGRIYQVRPSDLRVLDIGPTGLSTTADVIYHENVPAPTNLFVGPGKQYASTIASTPLQAVLQDGINQPWVVTSSLGFRQLGSYATWTYDNPEYVPIGTHMAFTGNRLIVASPDKLRQFGSVSGRPLDFVLYFDTITGAKLSDANGLAMAVSTAPLTALLAAQDGGFVASTRYRMHAASPQYDYLFFGEPYMRPKELFPVGAVGQQAFTQVAGETAYVSPSGIQLFNQTAQLLRESNLSPMGAPVSALLVKPIDRAACCTADDYAFFAVQTIFGPGIVVYDMQISQFVGIDLTTALVKEFAVYQDAGITRVFYITTANELFELPLFSGTKACGTLLFGEWVPKDRQGSQDPGRQHRITNCKLGLTNIKSSGFITVRSYIDQVEQQAQVLAVSQPVQIPLTGDYPHGKDGAAAVYNFDFSDTTNGYALGLQVDIAADLHLASLSIDVTEIANPAPSAISSLDPEHYIMLAEVESDARYTADFVSATGQLYFAEAQTTAETYVVNGGSKVILRAGGHVATALAAGAGRLFLGGNCAVYEYRTLMSTLANTPQPLGVFMLGASEATDKYAALFKVFDWLGLPVYAAANDLTQAVTARSQDFFGHARVPRYFLVAGRDVDFYVMSFPLTSGSPTELTPAGEYAQWIATSIAERRALSPKRINVLVSPISPADNATYATWPFARYGVHAVVSAGAEYRRAETDGVIYLDLEQGAKFEVQTTPRYCAIKYTAPNGTVDKISIVA